MVANTVKLDSNNDIDLSTNTIVFIEDEEFIKTKLIERLQTFLGEWYLDTTEGLPFFQEFFKAGEKRLAVISAIKNRILDTQGVVSVYDITHSFNGQTRKLNIAFKCKTDSSVIEIDTNIGL